MKQNFRVKPAFWKNSIFILVLIPAMGLAQPSLVVSASGDTSTAELQFDLRFDVKISIVAGDSILPLYPADIASVLTPSGQYFKVITTREGQVQIFVKVLMEGPIDLYKSGDKFYMQKEDLVVTLEHDKQENERLGYSVIQTSNKFRRTVNYLMSDCRGLTNEVQKTTFDERSFKNILELYALCHNKPVTDYPN